jgi:hypothetical protein
MILLAEATAWAAAGLLDIFGKKDPEEEKRKNAEVMTTQQNAVGRDFKLNKAEKVEAKIQLETKDIGGVELSERDKKWLEQRLTQPTGQGSRLERRRPIEQPNEQPIEQRASGGPVDAKTPYLIGEDGPELFIPSASGDVMSNATMKAMGNAPSTMPMPLPAPMGKTPSEMPSTDMFKDTKHLFDEILSTANVASKSMTSGYRKLDNSFDEILSTVDAGSKSLTTGYQDLDGSFDKILSTLNMSSESLTTGYQDLDGSFKEMLSTVDAGAKSITTKHQDLDSSVDNILSTVDTGSKSLTIKYQDLDSSFDKILSTLNAVSKSMILNSISPFESMEYKKLLLCKSLWLIFSSYNASKMTRSFS